MPLLARATHALVWATLLPGLPMASATAAPPAGATLSATLTFDIAAQPLSRALLEFSHQSGVQVTSPAKLLDGRESSRVAGQFSASEALSQLLAGTHLGYDVVDPTTVAIRPLPGALTLASAGQAEVSSTAGPEPESAPLEEVIVTGSNIAQAVGEAAKNAIPIETFSAEQFRSSAGETIADYLRSKPAFSGRNGTPTNHFYGGGESSLNLRGLGSAYTLVLINGRRAGGEDGIADVGAIPEEAIESVEILKSGSSAIYGANAVGGVVNFKLRRKFDGIEAVASYGNTTSHDATYKRMALLFGTGGARYRVTGSLAWQDRNGISKFDRYRTRSSDQRPFGGLDNRPTWMFMPFAIDGLDDSFTTYSIDASRVGIGGTSLDPADYIATPLAQSFDQFEPGTFPPYSRIGGHWSAELDVVPERLVLFTDGYYDRRRQVFEPIGRPIIGGGSFTPLTVAADNPDNPFGREVFVTYIVGPDEYAQNVENRFRTDGSLVTAGVHGALGSFGYEVAYNRYEQKKRITWANDVDAALAQAAVDAGELNPFSYWGNDPDLISSLILPDRNRYQKDVSEIYGAKVTGSLLRLPAGDLRFALGAERRKIQFGAHSDLAKATSGSYWDGPEAGSSAFTRDVDGYFGELSIPLFRGASGAFLSSIELSAAGRHEKYEDFGSVDIPQGAIRFGFLDESLILRASYAEGFRAPTLDELDPTPYPNILVGVYDPYFNDFVQASVIYGGNDQLDAEVGVTRNLGLVYQPLRLENLMLRLDYWQVKQSRTIQQPDVEAILRGTQPGSVVRDENGIATIDARLQNTGDRLIEGLDFGATWRTAMHDFGRLAFDFSTSYLTAVEHTFAEFTVKGLARYTDVFGSMPRYRMVLTTGWEKGAWSASTTLHFDPGVDEYVPSIDEHGPVKRRTAHYTTADLQVAYHFGRPAGALAGLLRETEIYGGVENLWDERLPFFASTYQGWDNSLHDFRGRYYYFGLRKRF